MTKSIPLSLLIATALLSACDPVAQIVRPLQPATDVCADLGEDQCQQPDPDDVSFGNILEQPFAEIWSSERYRALRETLAANRQPPECRNCSVFYA